MGVTQISSGALAGGLTNTLVYPLIYVRTVPGADLGKVKKYNSMADCLMKTVKEGGFLSLYNGIGPSTVGIVVYRGVQFGLQDTLKAFNPFQKDVGVVAIVSSSASRKWPWQRRASRRTRSTQCSAACRSRRPSRRASRFTTAWPTASPRS